MNGFWLVVLSAIVIRTQTGTPNFWILAWPGTVFHEFMHYAVGGLLYAKPCDFQLLPTAGENGRRILGSVSFTNIGWWNAAPVAMAPLLGIPIALVLAASLGAVHLTIGYCFAVWIIASILSQSVPSTEDFRIMWSQPTSVALWLGIVYVIFK